jgi:hypothetical protein
MLLLISLLQASYFLWLAVSERPPETIQYNLNDYWRCHTPISKEWISDDGKILPALIYTFFLSGDVLIGPSSDGRKYEIYRFRTHRVLDAEQRCVGGHQ